MATPVCVVVVLNVTPEVKVVAPVLAMVNSLRLLPLSMLNDSEVAVPPNPPAVNMNLELDVPLLGRKVKEAEELRPLVLVEVMDT